MEFKAKKPGSIKVFIEDKEYLLIKPKMVQQIALEKACKDAKSEDGSILKSMVDWIVSLGLPEDVAMNMDQETFMDLISFISGEKKS